MQAVIKKSFLYAPLSYSFFGLILVVDQLLIPMFHFSGIPFKISYLTCGLWLINFLVKSNRNEYEDKEFKFFVYPIIIIMICGVLGEIYFNGWWRSDGLEPLVRNLLIYILAILSFGLGLSCKKFDINWLIPIILTAIFLNFAFIFFKFELPSWLVNFYYSERYIADFAGLGLLDAQSILELARPRGLFPNPNGSAFLVNIISLFIYLGIRNKLCSPPNPMVYFLIILLPIVLCGLLASRGEFVSSLILSFLHIRSALKVNKKYSLKLIAFFTFIPIFLGSYLVNKIDISEFQNNIERAFSVVQIINNTGDDIDEETKSLSSIARPLQVFIPAFERFKISPIFGSGFATDSSHQSFKEGTDYFHNDWFRLIVTSGILGLLAMLWLINRFILILGWPALIPFVFPGMINTFLLNIPAVMFYFFMVGLIRSRIKSSES